MRLTLGIELKNADCLPKILLLCKRLGGKITYVSFAGKFVTMSLDTPEDRMHRFAPQIRRIIDVLTLVELKADVVERQSRRPQMPVPKLG